VVEVAPETVTLLAITAPTAAVLAVFVVLTRAVDVVVATLSVGVTIVEPIVVAWM